MKKLLFSFLTALTLFFSFVPYLAPIKAQTASPSPAPSTWYDQSFDEWVTKVNDKSNPTDIFGERYTAAQVQWIIYSLIYMILPEKDAVTCMASGELTGPSGCFEAMKQKLGIASIRSTHDQNLASLVFTNNRPVSFISYFDSLKQRLSPVSVVHAQEGFGFSGLDIIRDLWISARNISYSLFVLAAIVLAFMVMFRVKISPQVVITVQSAIPKLLIALVLVTFSYAIAGLLVDLMYVVYGILSLALSGVTNWFSTDPVAIFKFLTEGDIGIASLPFGVFGLLALYLIVATVVFFAVVFAGAGGVVVQAPLTLASGGSNLAVMLILGIIAFVLLAILCIVNFFKLVFMLLKTFAQLLLLTVIAPFQITMGAVVPQSGFGSWIKSFIGNLAVFPMTSLMLALSFVFLNISAQYAALGDINNIPALGGTYTIGQEALNAAGWPPLIGGGEGTLALIFIAVSLIIFMMTPKVAEIIKSIITKRPFDYGSAIGQAVGPITAAGTAYAQYEVSEHEQGAAIGTPEGQSYIPDWWVNALKTFSRGKIK